MPIDLATAAEKSAKATEIETLKRCRDHWQAAFEHERAIVIRLRNELSKYHGEGCVCFDCLLVKSKGPRLPYVP